MCGRGRDFTLRQIQPAGPGSRGPAEISTDELTTAAEISTDELTTAAEISTDQLTTAAQQYQRLGRSCRHIYRLRGKAGVTYGVCVQQVGVELGHVPELAGLEPVDRVNSAI